MTTTQSPETMSDFNETRGINCPEEFNGPFAQSAFSRYCSEMRRHYLYPVDLVI